MLLFMSENQNDKLPSEPTQEQQGPPPTPFDHPLFLPVLLFGGVLWFGYDGWIETDPGMLEHRLFNRVGFAIVSVLAAWFGYKGIREFKQDRADAERSASSDSESTPPTSTGS